MKCVQTAEDAEKKEAMYTANRRKLAPHRWKKVLYEQVFQDNYTDPTFLSELKRNVFLHKYTFVEAVLPLCSVTLEICGTLLFVTIFAFLDQGTFAPEELMWGSTICIILLVGLYVLIKCYHALGNKQQEVLWMMGNGIGLLFCGYEFSPSLKSLTETISTDTIYAMAAVMLFIHVALQDYFSGCKIKYSCVSLNSGLFAAVCLASRLSTDQHTFALSTFAVQIFIFIPWLRIVIQDYAVLLMVFTAFFVLFVAGLLFLLQPLYAVLFISSCGFINLLCPKLFVQYQVYKENIHGPWDEAVIKDDASP